MRPWIMSLAEAEAQWPPASEPVRFVDVLAHGTMTTGFYAPRGLDIQTPHDRDDPYVVIAGRGVFVKNGERRNFAANAAILVEAGADRRFEDFTDDFAAWAVFWRPEGGEMVTTE